MDLGEIVTKDDLEAMERRIVKKLLELVKPTEKMLSLDEACEYLGGMNKKTLQTKASTFEIASHKTGKHICFRRSDLDAYLEQTRRMSNHELDARARL